MGAATSARLAVFWVLVPLGLFIVQIQVFGMGGAGFPMALVVGGTSESQQTGGAAAAQIRLNI